MDAPDEEPNDENPQSQESSGQGGSTKVRDLKPEKDPMGAGNLTAQNPASIR